MIDGAPKRFGDARVISYADFCLAHGLTWDPSVDGVDVHPEVDDRLPDVSHLPERISRTRREPRCKVEPTREPVTRVTATITVDRHAPDEASTYERDLRGSLRSIADRTRAGIETTVCVHHDPPRARVVVPMSDYGMGWSIEGTCCAEFSAKLVVILKAARKEVRAAIRKAKRVPIPVVIG